MKEVAYRNFGNLTEAEQKEIRKWVRDNEAAWREFVQGSLKKYCYREYGFHSENEVYRWLFNVIMPHLKPLRNLAKAGIWRSRISLGQGHMDQAVEDCLVIVHAGRHWQDRAFLIEQLVGLAISRLGCDEILHMTAKRNLSAIELKQLQQQLLEIYPSGFPLVDIESERLMFLDTVQHVFTEGGPGGGHLIPRSIHMSGLAGDINREAGVLEAGVLRVVAYTGGSMIHARRNETIVQGNKMYDKIAEVLKMSPYERHIRQVGSEDVFLNLPKYRYLILGVLTPAGDRVSEIRYWGKTLYEATVTVLALERWRLERNGYPADLDELVTTGYLKELPMDPFSDKPLVYKKTDDDFILYSVGPVLSHYKLNNNNWL